MRLFGFLISFSLFVSGYTGDFEVKINGTEVQVHEQIIQGRYNCSYIHYVHENPVKIQVKVTGGISDWSLSPVANKGFAQREGSLINLTIPKPSYLVLYINNKRLLILTDPPSKSVTDSRIVVSDSGVDSTGKTDSTLALQKILDEASKSGSTVVFPKGTYLTTGLKVGSNTNIYFEQGALLQGSKNPEDYQEFPKKPNSTGITSLLKVSDAENVYISGYGTMDARGYDIAGDATKIEDVKLKTRCFTIERSHNVKIEGVICTGATSWTVPFYNSTKVSANRVKVINDIGPLKHSDGINMCAVVEGLVENSFVHTTDDAYCAKGYKGGPTRGIIFRNLIALSGTRGLKCGMQAYEDLDNVLFENVDVVETRDGIDLMHWNGNGKWSNITFRNIRIERCNRRSITATVREGGSISSVTFQKIFFPEKLQGWLRGKDSQSVISNVSFSDMFIGGQKITDLEQFNITPNKYTTDITFK